MSTGSGMSSGGNSGVSSGSSTGRSPERPIFLKPIVRPSPYTGFLPARFRRAGSSTATTPGHGVQLYGLGNYNDPVYDEPTEDEPLASPSPEVQQKRPGRSLRLRLVLVGLALAMLVAALALTGRVPASGALELEFTVSTGAAIDPIRGQTAGQDTASSTSIVIPSFEGPSAADMAGDALAWAISLLQQLLGWWYQHPQLNGTTEPPTLAVKTPENELNAPASPPPPPDVLVIELSGKGRLAGTRVIDLELSVSVVDPFWTAIARHTPVWLRAITGIRAEPPRMFAIRLVGAEPAAVARMIENSNGSQRCALVDRDDHTPGSTAASNAGMIAAAPTRSTSVQAPAAITNLPTAALVLPTRPAVEQAPPDPSGRCAATAGRMGLAVKQIGVAARECAALYTGNVSCTGYETANPDTILEGPSGRCAATAGRMGLAVKQIGVAARECAALYTGNVSCTGYETANPDTILEGPSGSCPANTVNATCGVPPPPPPPPSLLLLPTPIPVAGVPLHKEGDPRPSVAVAVAVDRVAVDMSSPEQRADMSLSAEPPRRAPALIANPHPALGAPQVASPLATGPDLTAYRHDDDDDDDGVPGTHLRLGTMTSTSF